MTHPPRVEHSPLPWSVGMTKLSDAAVYDSNNQCICVIIDENKADTETAAFIVAACNAYSANQKALGVAVDELRCIAKMGEEIQPEWVDWASIGKNAQRYAARALERIREIQEGI